MTSADRSFDAMLLKIQELEDRALTASLYDTRPHDEAAVISIPDADAASPYGEAIPDTADAIGYINHEWRTVSAAYDEAGLIKSDTASPIDPIFAYLLVDDPANLTLKITRDGNHYCITATVGNNILYQHVLDDDTLGLEEFPG